MAYIYRHIRKDKNQVFYIGIGSDENGEYLRAYTFRQSRSSHWKGVYKKTDIEVDIIEDDLSFAEAKEKEKWWIKFYGRKDINEGTLVNKTDGGDGCIGIVWGNRGPKSPEVKEKISRKLKGKCFLTDEGRKRIIQTSTGRRHSSETKKLLSELNTGKKLTETHIEKMKKSKTGKKITGQALQNIRLANVGKNKGVAKTEIHKQKLSEALKGRPINYKRAPMSEEQKEKIRAKLKGIPQNKLQCPHCNKIGGAPAMYQSHFDKCKNRLE